MQNTAILGFLSNEYLEIPKKYAVCTWKKYESGLVLPASIGSNWFNREVFEPIGDKNNINPLISLLTPMRQMSVPICFFIFPINISNVPSRKRLIEQ